MSCVLWILYYRESGAPKFFGATPSFYLFFRYDRRFIRALSEIYLRFIDKFSARIADTSKKALSAHERKPFSVFELFHHDFGLFKLF